MNSSILGNGLTDTGKANRYSLSSTSMQYSRQLSVMRDWPKFSDDANAKPRARAHESCMDMRKQTVQLVHPISKFCRQNRLPHTY